MNETQLKLFEKQLAAEIKNWETRLREGYNVRQMFEFTIKDAPEPLAGEVRQVLAAVTEGTPFVEALKAWLARTPSEGLNLVVSTMLVQRETGGNLADIFQVVGHILEKKFG